MSNSDFTPSVRFMVVSDVHIKDEPSVERERFDNALKTAYRIAESSDTYKNLDAVAIVGDFANSGTEIQMNTVKKILDENLDYNKTKLIISVASHEYHSEGVEAAYEKLKRIFGSDPDVHEVINGFHFVSVSPSHSCNFDDNKIAWVSSELEKAAEADRKKPIFMFQHPHNTGTVYGSILWGEDELITTYMNYPQIIHFSGHSHAPINDPRSIHQQHFTSLGTGTLSYFELDEFDKLPDKVPDNSEKAAQMLIVEADDRNRVRIYPYDLITGNYFPIVHKIDVPSEPSTFTYTNARYRDAVNPYFDENAKISAEIGEASVKIEFDQAKIDKEYVNSYDIIIREDSTGSIVKQLSIWSEYYFYDMPATRSVTVKGLKKGTEYTAQVIANSFWSTSSENSLTLKFKTA